MNDLIEKLDKKYQIVNVVCGSARQNVKVDNFNRYEQSKHYAGYQFKMKVDEGSVFTDLEKFVSNFNELFTSDKFINYFSR